MSWLLLIALALGALTGWVDIPVLKTVASGIGDIIIRMLKLVSLPMIFLSVVATISGMQNFAEIRTMGRKVVTYAVGTTFLAALLGLGLFSVIRPVGNVEVNADATNGGLSGSYWDTLVNLVPENVAQVFIDNHVLGVMFMAVVLGLSILSLPQTNRKTLNHFFSSFFSAILKITHWLIYLMPLAVWAFVTTFTHTILHDHPERLGNFFLYLLCVVLANVIQAFVILPILLKVKGISPLRLAKHMLSALTLAFFTRSSNAALPVTLECAEEKAGLSRKVSNFSLPLCSTINMNGCSAFILITVLFVAGSHGVTFSLIDMFMWVGIATLAAVGNAGVAMGCYFLSGALLAAMDVPLTILGMILPAYTFIDMLETTVNVWSDSCVTAIVDKELKAKDEVEETDPEPEQITA